MIEVTDLTHRYGSLLAVDELSFTVREGEVLGLLGPNGAGKSTALRATVGLLTPSAGRIRIGGHDIAQEPLAARRLLGFLPEAVSLYPELKVREFLCSVARMKGVARTREEDELERVIELCALQQVASRLIGFCSRGYRQRIGLAQALVGDPPALVLDEPTVGLDPGQIVEIRERIADLAREKAVILSTHIIPEAQRLCTRVLILNHGRCMAEDEPTALQQSLHGGNGVRLVLDQISGGQMAEEAQRILTRLDFVRAFQPRESPAGRCAFSIELEHPSAAARLVDALVRSDFKVCELSPENLGLEEVFLHLVREEKGAEVR
jgi:ABC-2 type transport system ATP-binding protein